mmetsp:Transcript_23093/g.33826  ORF Transcript_23093/g.33826 Transcript_23093/m.33826 type:complete len:134 (+) Transcript_23093:106-507(+)
MLRSLLLGIPGDCHESIPTIVTRDTLISKTDNCHDSKASRRRPSFDDIATTISDSNSIYSSSSCEEYVSMRVMKCINCDTSFFPQYSRFEDSNFCSKDCSTCFSWFYKKRTVHNGPKEIPASNAVMRVPYTHE